MPSAAVFGDVHIGQSAISPMPMGKAIATRSTTRTNPNNTFIDVRLPAPGHSQAQSPLQKLSCHPMETASDRSGAIFKALWGASATQVAGRFLDFWWHATHDEFETGRDQFTAHWLVLARNPLRGGRDPLAPWHRPRYRATRLPRRAVVERDLRRRRRYHFIQHLNLQEVDWAHILLAVTNIGSVVGVLMVTAARRRRTTPAIHDVRFGRRREREGPALVGEAGKAL